MTALVSLVTNAGLGEVVDALVASQIKWIGWGGGSGQTVSDTDLDAALPENRTSGAVTVATTNTTDDTYRVAGAIAATAARTVSEVGVFSASTGASLVFYGSFNPISLNINEVVNFIVDVVVDQA
jgi:hypothetical protein